ncbi:MAG: 3-dehydroquinate synthase [Deltaproteobacteria bacterium RIFCSPLOWO2_12_FULL_50_11]|nr:MAG: 3-dehydroquinate synthase [Deltaproteobacteria bacterium RIFCSPHIGHO2_02_FULL_50_15]OGQ68433.1 MAG: 3-dehydroquinate synthase [Deltaproteobacteria bacterium RIFCSPLOWO2_12_FULL_50_11]
MKKIEVILPHHRYAIHVTQGDLSPLADYLKSHWSDYRLIVLTNARVKRHCLPSVSRALGRKGLKLETILIPDGEVYKNQKTVNLVYQKLFQLKADRKTLLLLLGGGVVGDLGGFVAATFLRGLPYVQLPTTVVAQVDSSIGGKVGIDHEKGKNLIGAFYQPVAVFSDVHWLQSLSGRQLRAGLAEVVKYGVIWEPAILEYLECYVKDILQARPVRMQWLVEQSSAIKSQVVQIDEKESGLRMILNFGHTLGHGIEKLMDYKRWLHGEAVAAGMVYAARLSCRHGYCRKEILERLTKILELLQLPTTLPAFAKKRYLHTMVFDKKRRGKRLNFVCVRRMGHVFTHPLTPSEILREIQ